MKNFPSASGGGIVQPGVETVVFVWHEGCPQAYDMYKQSYIVLSGALVRLKRLDVISQNLANIDTVGYKRADVAFELFSLDNGGGETDMEKAVPAAGSVVIDFSPGDLVHTGNPLDIAVEGEGFISLEGGLYTRRGDLAVDSDGYLVTRSGRRVLGHGGQPIKVAPGADIDIDGRGRVSADGAEVDTIRVVTLPAGAKMVRAGGAVFYSPAPAAVVEARVRTGVLEASNVSPMMEMFKMITVLREFERYQKAVQLFDEAAAKINNEVARV